MDRGRMKCCWKARCDKQYGGIRHFQGFHLCCIMWNGWEMVSLFSQDFVMRQLGHRGWLTVKTGGEYWWLLIASQKQERGNSSSFKIEKRKMSQNRSCFCFRRKPRKRSFCSLCQWVSDLVVCTVTGMPGLKAVQIPLSRAFPCNPCQLCCIHLLHWKVMTEKSVFLSISLSANRLNIFCLCKKWINKNGWNPLKCTS